MKVRGRLAGEIAISVVMESVTELVQSVDLDLISHQMVIDIKVALEFLVNELNE